MTSDGGVEMKITYRQAEREDLSDIVNLIKGAFSPRYIEMMIWGCRGIEKYLADLIDSERELCDISNYVATVGDKVVAVAQLKRNPADRQLYLNYICTDYVHRRSNIASKLLLHSIVEEPDNFDVMALDVFVDNSIARKWYSDIGFGPVFTKQWIVAEGMASDSCNGYISGFPQSDRCFAEYGFSQFTLTTESRSYSIGLLGEDYFRISDGKIFQDLAAISTLAKFAPTRKLLLIAADPVVDNAMLHFNNVAETIQMNVSIATLINSIKNKQLKVKNENEYHQTISRSGCS